MVTKKEIRQHILKQRNDMSFAEVQELSKEICEKIKGLDIYIKAKNICLYMPVNNEVDVTLLADNAWQDGKALWLPKTSENTMGFFKFSHDTVLSAGTFGVLEPISDDRLEPDSDTLVLMPGVAFSPDGGRVGYGSGYYDRYLNGHEECMTAAVCYGFQILPEIPMEEHDVKPDMIVCESGCINEYSK